MQVHQVPALGGVLWMRDGWRLFKRQPIGLPAMVVFYMLMVIVPLLLPDYVDQAALMLISPFATVGVMTACREIGQGRAPTVLVFGAAFREPGARSRLLRLGLINAALALLLTLLVRGLGLHGLYVEAGADGTPTISDVDWLAIMINFLLLAPVLAVMCFSPMLVAWHGMTPAKAMFGSALACLRNLGSLFVYGNAVVLFVFLVVWVVFGAIAQLTSSQSVQSMFIAPIGLIVVSIVQASYYAMYASIFSQDA